MEIADRVLLLEDGKIVLDQLVDNDNRESLSDRIHQYFEKRV
jgi:hypothetical protein